MITFISVYFIEKRVDLSSQVGINLYVFIANKPTTTKSKNEHFWLTFVDG